MDLDDEEWVNVPYDGLLEVHDDGDEKFFSRKYVTSPTKFYESNYFYSTKTYQDYVKDEPIFEKQLDHEEEVKEIIKLPILIESERGPDSNQDSIFHVFLNKENQFVEMKMGSPRLSSQEFNLSHVETASFQHDDEHDDHEVDCSSPSKMIKKEVVDWKESNQRASFWKWGLSGIGVFCSVGMTAATICIIICGSGRRHKLQHQKLRIQIYPENKSLEFNMDVWSENKASGAKRK